MLRLSLVHALRPQHHTHRHETTPSATCGPAGCPDKPSTCMPTRPCPPVLPGRDPAACLPSNPDSHSRAAGCSSLVSPDFRVPKRLQEPASLISQTVTLKRRAKQPEFCKSQSALQRLLACLQEPAYLLRQTVNLEQRGEVREETLSSGHYSLIDIRCKCCHAAIGWQYLRASNPVSCPVAVPLGRMDAGHMLPWQWALSTSGPLLQVLSFLSLGCNAVPLCISNLVSAQLLASLKPSARPMLL